MKVDGQFLPTVGGGVEPRAARRILAISPTVAGLGAIPRVSIESIYYISESSSS